MPVAVQGTAAAWDEGRGTLALADAVPVRGPRAARRAVRAARRLPIVVGPATVLVAEDADGYRERLGSEDLFAVLDDATERLRVEASGRMGVPAVRVRGARPRLAAVRVVVHLPAPEEGDDPYGEDIDALPGDEGLDDEPLIDPDDPDLDG